MTLLLFVLAAWGGGYIIAESKLFQRPRTWAAYIPPFVTINYQKDDGAEGEMRTTYLRLLLTCAACSGLPSAPSVTSPNVSRPSSMGGIHFLRSFRLSPRRTGHTTILLA